MKLVLVLSMLVLGSLASFDEAFFRKLPDTEFGKTILQTIQLEIGSEGNTTPDRVLELLRQMQGDLQQEQEEETGKIAGRLEGCQGKIGDAQDIIKKANEKRADDERTLPLLQEEQQDKITQSTDKTDQERRNLDRLELLRQQRTESKKDFEDRRDELMGLVATLQEAKGIVAQLKSGGGSFLQVSDPVLSEIKAHQQKFLKHYPKQRGFHALVTVMLEALQDNGLQRSQDGVAKVIEVIQSLIESIYDVQKQELQADDKRQQDYQNQKTRLEGENSRLEGTISYQKAQIELISQKILELRNDIATQQQIADAKSTEKKDWETTCTDSQHAYDLQAQSRKDQLDIINEAIEIFETRFSDSIGAFIARIRID